MISNSTGYKTPVSSLLRTIDSELDHLNSFMDIQAVFLFRIDGYVLKSLYSENCSSNLLLVIGWVKQIISKTMEELQRGSRSVKYDKEIQINESIPVYFYRAGQSSILVTFLRARANTGLMEIEMSRTAKRLSFVIDKFDDLEV